MSQHRSQSPVARAQGISTAAAAPRVVATDLDGTVVRSDGSISTRTRSALGLVEAAGATLVLVTGRPPRWLAGMAEQTGHRGIAICANGALVYDLHIDQVVSSRPFAVADARRVAADLRAAIPGLTFAAERVGDGRVDDGFVREPAYRPRWSAQTVTMDDLDDLLSEPMVKLLARHDALGSDELLALARGAVGEELASMTHSSNDGLLEISAAGISKATALADFCAERDVDAAEVIAFGDMPNDLPMLSWAGRGVAVANAHPDVLAAVTEVTASNDDDGVADVLERLYGR